MHCSSVPLDIGDKWMRIYSRDYFLRKILGCTEVELEIAKEHKKEVCQEFKIRWMSCLMVYQR